MSISIDTPEPGKVVLIVLTAERSAASALDLGDDGAIRPLVLQAALDEAIKGLQGGAGAVRNEEEDVD